MRSARLYHGALVDEVSGGLNPAQYVAGLARGGGKSRGNTPCAGTGQQARAWRDSGEALSHRDGKRLIESEIRFGGDIGLYGKCHKKIAKEDHPDRVVHHRDGKIIRQTRTTNSAQRTA